MGARLAGAVLVCTADQHDRRAEIKDGWLADDMGGIHFLVSPSYEDGRLTREFRERTPLFALKSRKVADERTTDLMARHSDAPGLPIRLSPAHRKTRLSIAMFAKQFCLPQRH
jgi:hypothetical protein